MKEFPEKKSFEGIPRKIFILQESYKKIVVFVNVKEISYLVRPRNKNGYIVVIWQKTGYLVGIWQKNGYLLGICQEISGRRCIVL